MGKSRKQAGKSTRSDTFSKKCHFSLPPKRLLHNLHLLLLVRFREARGGRSSGLRISSRIPLMCNNIPNFARNMISMTAQSAIPQPFNNAQLELLKLFADNVPEEDLLAIKELISRYFFEKAKNEADQIWEAKGMDSHELLKKHRRTPYRKLQP